MQCAGWGGPGWRQVDLRGDERSVPFQLEGKVSELHAVASPHPPPSASPTDGFLNRIVYEFHSGLKQLGKENSEQEEVIKLGGERGALVARTVSVCTLPRAVECSILVSKHQPHRPAGWARSLRVG